MTSGLPSSIRAPGIGRRYEASTGVRYTFINPTPYVGRMIEATSAGAILFRDTRGRREYLLLKSRPGDWEFPKGGVEGDEELQQTAIREVKEEAGIEDFRLLDGFREEYDYVFEAGGDTIHKTVHLFVAKSFEASAELSEEHRDMQWRDYEQAVNTITQDGPRDILEEADEFIDENYGK